jgi:hypothetical protein
MNDHVTLAAALARTAAEFNRLEPPPALWHQVLDRAIRPRVFALRPWALGGAICAAAMLGTALMILGPPQRPPAPQDAGAGDFLPLVPAERWPRDPAQAWLVSTEMSSERLASLGLPIDPAHAGDSVRAELLVRASGEVLAVRFFH